MNDNFSCEICGALGKWNEFPGLRRRQVQNRKEGVLHCEVQRKRRKAGAPIVCEMCLADPTTAHIVQSFQRVYDRHCSRFDAPPLLTVRQLWDIAMSSGYGAMLESAARTGDRMLGPSIDRINSWQGYDADNIQILTWRDNSTKGNRPALGARHLTMKFFHKLREEKGLTKYEMAQFLGMQPSTYYYYEDEARGCSFEILCLVRRKMEISWERLGQMIDEEFGKPLEQSAPKRPRGSPRKSNS